MKEYFKLVLSLLVLIAGLYATLYWFSEFLIVVKGVVGVLIFLVGLAVLLLAISELW